MNNFTLKNMALHPAMSGTRSRFSPAVLQFSLFVFFVLFRFSVIAQNLVPNPSFEIFDTCPNQQDQVRFATGWSNYWDADGYSSPDYFNACSTNPSFSVPYNWGGYQQAADGNAYIGIYTFESTIVAPNIREYVGAKLLSPLVIGTKYYISFKTNLALDINHIFNKATNNVGLLFSMVPHNMANPVQTNNFSHLYSVSVITDTVNWTTISGSFIADSAYQYIIIGNFFDDTHTIGIQQSNPNGNDSAAYYYVDAIYVSTDSLPGGIAEQDLQGKVKAYPNPSDGLFNISLNNFLLYSIKVYDEFGKLVFSSLENISNNFFLDLRKEKKGIYFLLINDGQRVITKKLIKE